MTEDDVLPPHGRGPTERKTKASALAAFVVALVGLSVLSSSSTDMIAALPDWLEAPAYSLVSAAIVWLSGYVTSHAPDRLSRSAVEAAQRVYTGKHR
ncbi:MAG TPA: hypothetical protein VFU47_12970 [Armatimonadota bacterium]|nr:hypothetical protein [Armatimonadota bacterium]